MHIPSKRNKAFQNFSISRLWRWGQLFCERLRRSVAFSVIGYQAFLKKNFVGIAQEIAIGIHLKKNIDIKLGFNRQRFTRKVYVNDTLPRGVGLLLDHRIQHIDNMWFGGMTKIISEKKSVVMGSRLVLHITTTTYR